MGEAERDTRGQILEAGQGGVSRKGLSARVAARHRPGGGRDHRRAVRLLRQQGGALRRAGSGMLRARDGGVSRRADGVRRAAHRAAAREHGRGQPAVDVREMLLYMHEHRDEFHLLLCSAEGTRYASTLEEPSIWRSRPPIAITGCSSSWVRPHPPSTSRLEHILVTGMMNAYFEMIVHDMPLESDASGVSGRAERFLHRGLDEDHGAVKPRIFQHRG